jgi:Fic family protein
MTTKKSAKKSAKSPAKNGGESIGQMEPLIISDVSKKKAALIDLAMELASKSSGFRRSLPLGLITALAHMVRSMNCYYSNLIEGHNTHPIDIEKAMQGDYSANKKKRNLQLEAKAHIAVQKWIDEGGLKGRTLSTEGLREIHRRFCELLPEELLWVEDEATGKREQVIPGEFRERDVAVGQHIAVSPGAIAAFLGRFEEVYGRLGKSETVLAAAAAPPPALRGFTRSWTEMVVWHG